jgi:hypothetical protein
LNLSRPLASAGLAAVIVMLLIVLPQRPGRHPSAEHDGEAMETGSEPEDEASPDTGHRPDGS